MIQAVETLLKSHAIACYSFDDQVILPPISVKTLQGNYYRIFTPYKHTWLKELQQVGISRLPSPKPQAPLGIHSSPIPIALKEFKSLISADLWPSGEAVAQQRLKDFIQNNLNSYDKDQNFPAKAGTSQSSPI